MIKKIIFLPVLALLLASAISTQAHAAQFITPSDNENNITVNNSQPIDDNLFVIGDNITITSPITGDLFAVGNDINIKSDIKGNLFVIGKDITYQGTLQKDAFVLAQKLSLVDGSTIEKNLYANVQEVSANANQVVKEKMVVGKHQAKPASRSIVLETLSQILVGMLLLTFLPNFGRRIVLAGQKDWGKSLLYGVVTFIVAPLSIVLLALSGVGLPLSLMVLVGFFFGLYLSTFAISFLLGRTILKDKSAPIVAFVLGLILLQILRFNPITGPISQIVVFIFGLGVLVHAKLATLRQIRQDL